VGSLETRLKKIEARRSTKLKTLIFLNVIRDANGYRIGDKQFIAGDGETLDDVRARIQEQGESLHRRGYLIALGIRA